jgi:hypothetical protein
VRALADVGNRLFPLKQRQERGEPLTEDERDLLAALEEEYRELELELRSLMRPRVKDPERDAPVLGRDHLHGPDHPAG